MWNRPVGENILDGGAPWYGVYTCLDGKFISVGAIEPRFYSTFIWTLSSALQSSSSNLEMPHPKDQYDRTTWPALRQFLEAAFKTKTRDEWASIFIGTDSCVAPVLVPSEVGEEGDETGEGRGKEGGAPEPTPRLVRTPAKSVKGVYDGEGKGYWKAPGEDTRDILVGAGFTGPELERLIQEGEGRESKL
jgi:alpha-methylacyl-CoA racemase